MAMDFVLNTGGSNGLKIKFSSLLSERILLLLTTELKVIGFLVSGTFGTVFA